MSIEIRSCSSRQRGYLVYKDGEPLNGGAPIKSLKDASEFACKHGASGGWVKRQINEGYGTRHVWEATGVASA